MIVNRPKPNIFEKQSVQYLIQAVNLIYEKERDLDLISEGMEIERAEFWNYHQGILANALTLLFQSLENYLKHKISSVSPFLLIAAEPKNWGSSKKNIDYNNLFMHSYDDLLVLYLELELGSINEQTATKLQELKTERNLITHGVLNAPLTTEHVMQIFYEITLYIWGPKTWWLQLKNHIFNEPLFGLYDSDVEKAYLNLYVDFFVRYFGLKRTGEMFGVDFKQRRYFCPYCNHWLNKDVDVGDAKYAVLIPNRPKSTNIYCVVCDQNYTVMRRNCSTAECKGNVISDDGRCLSCFNGQRKV